MVAKESFNLGRSQTSERNARAAEIVQKLELTDVDSVERVSNERSFAHVVVFVVDLQTPNASDETARRSGLRRRFADVLESAEKQLTTKRHQTKQALNT